MRSELIFVGLALGSSVLALSEFGPAPYQPAQEQLERSRIKLAGISKALHAYAAANGDTLADDIRDKDGRPLLSWRVSLLPYMGEQQLHGEFKLDEPWDSAHNRRLITKMPRIYAPVRGRVQAGETFYQRFVGEGALFTAKGPTHKRSSILGTCAAVVVEGGEPVVWSQPSDLSFSETQPLPKLGGMFEGRFHVLFWSDSINLFKPDFDADGMKKLLGATAQNADFKKLTNDPEFVTRSRRH